MMLVGGILIYSYFLGLLWLLTGFWKLPKTTLQKFTPKHTFSIIIPFRNEALRIENLLESLQNITYPKDHFELLFVDDASEDNSVSIVTEALTNSEFSWRILPNERRSNAPKKDAITAAIEKSRFNWIVTTDADCSVQPEWLESMNEFIQAHNPKMLCGPVLISGDQSMFNAFQQYENINLQGVTMGSFGWNIPMLCNGANLAFEKKIFEEVGGYAGNDTIASGDDIFLMEKVRQLYPKDVHFLKSNHALVATTDASNIKEALMQRIRWAGKTRRQNNPRAQILGILVALINLWIVAGLFWCLNWKVEFIIFYFGIFAIKITSEIIFLFGIDAFFRSRPKVITAIILGLIYPFFSSFILFRSMIGTYRWKGRSFKM